jgi:DNA-binding transcriptional ArsR family regulator
VATYYSSVADTNGAEKRDEVTPERITTSDPEVLRALAHPARLAIMEHLSAYGGEITATEAADVVGLSPSATSYHLRTLAKVNLIKEAPSRGDGRERVYSGAPSRKVEITTDPDTTDPATLIVSEQLLDAVLARNEERIRRWRAAMHEEPKAWMDSSMIHEALIMVTQEELEQINDQLMDVLEPFRRSRRPEPPEGSRLVAVQLRSIPVR